MCIVYIIYPFHYFTTQKVALIHSFLIAHVSCAGIVHASVEKVRRVGSDSIFKQERESNRKSKQQGILQGLHNNRIAKGLFSISV